MLCDTSSNDAGIDEEMHGEVPSLVNEVDVMS